MVATKPDNPCPGGGDGPGDRQVVSQQVKYMNVRWRDAHGEKDAAESLGETGQTLQFVIRARQILKTVTADTTECLGRAGKCCFLALVRSMPT